MGRPSKAAGEKVQAEDASRIEVQKTSLGTEGLKKKGQELTAAEDENDVETPEEVSAEFQVPDVGKVQLIATRSDSPPRYSCHLRMHSPRICDLSLRMCPQ